MSIYDDNAPALIKQGYSALPIAPLGFEPKKAPVRFETSIGRLVLFRGWQEAEPIRTPQPGANIGVRCGGGLIAIDCDGGATAAAARLSRAHLGAGLSLLP